MLKLLLVGSGGFLGSISRYVLSGAVYRILGNPNFPWGTLVVNVVGCLLIGFLGGLAESRQMFTQEARLLIFIGFLGGFTTFSTFGYEVMSFARHGEMLSSLWNVLLHVALGLSAAWLGYHLSKLI